MKLSELARTREAAPKVTPKGVKLFQKLRLLMTEFEKLGY